MRIRTSIWRLTFVLLLSSGLLVNPHQLHGQDSQRASEEAKRWLDEFTASYNRHDARAAAALYALDADQRVSTGELLRGRAEIERYLADLFARSPEARQQLSLTSARFSGPDLLLAEAAWEVTGLPDGRSARGVATYFLRRQGDRWLCIAGRSMVPTRPIQPEQ